MEFEKLPGGNNSFEAEPSNFPNKLIMDDPVPREQLASSVFAYLENQQAADTLKPTQQEVFGDIANFIANHDTHGYIDMPTGTGKTVLFVELVKALTQYGENERKPRILVVAPKKDLVIQTVGRDGTQGFGKFAPNLDIITAFSDSTKEEKDKLHDKDYDVVVTTYHTLGIMNRSRALQKLPEGVVNVFFSQLDLDDNHIGRSELIDTTTVDGEKKLEEILQEHPGAIITENAFSDEYSKVDDFDVIIFDEAHRALGQSRREVVESLRPGTLAIGFTATPDASHENLLQHVMPHNIHSMKLNEAINLKLLAPITTISLPSGLEIRGSDIYDANGEFRDSGLRNLATDEKRNKLVVTAIKRLIDNGIQPIVPCIAGEEAWHARHIAESTSALGQGYETVAVHAKVSAKDRKRIYDQYAEGKIKALTYIGVLGEGWDSPIAKGIVNARPTRSVIVATQRLGRITRPYADKFGVCIDIVDDYADVNKIAISAADILGEGTLELGQFVGEITDEQMSRAEKVLTSFEDLNPSPETPNHYERYEDLLSIAKTATRGKVWLDTKGNTREGKNLELNPDYAIASQITTTYLNVTDEKLRGIAQSKGIDLPEIDVITNGRLLRKAFDVSIAKDLLYNLPDIDSTRYFIDETGSKWASLDGVSTLLSSRFPTVSYEEIQEAIDRIEKDVRYAKENDGRRGIARRYDVFELYPVNKDFLSELVTKLEEYVDIAQT